MGLYISSVGLTLVVSLMPLAQSGTRIGAQAKAYLDALERQDKLIRTFEVTFESEWTGSMAKNRVIELKMDEQARSWKAKVLTRIVTKDGKEKTVEDHYAQNSQFLWERTSELGRALDRIDIYPAGKSLVREGSYLRGFDLKPLKAGFVPLHRVVYGQEVQRVEAVGLTDMPGNTKRLECVIKFAGDGHLKAIYELEGTDSIKILRGRLENAGKPLYEVQNSKHVKADGVWVAHEIVYRDFGQSEAPPEGDVIRLSIGSFKANPGYSDKDFALVPNRGEDIYDNAAGIRYTYGESAGGQSGTGDQAHAPVTAVDGKNHSACQGTGGAAPATAGETPGLRTEPGGQSESGDQQAPKELVASGSFHPYLLAVILCSLVAAGLAYVVRRKKHAD